MTCDAADLLLAAAALGETDAAQDEALRAHLHTCSRCPHLTAEYRRTANLLPLALAEAEPPAQLRDRLMAQVRAEPQGQRRPISPASRWQRLWQRVPRSRSLTAGGAGVMAAAIAVAVLALVGPLRPAAPPATAPVTVAVRGTAVQPAAQGTLLYDASRQQATLTVSGLTPPYRGNATAVYEVWLIPAHGAAVGVAFLSADPGGKGWSALLQGQIAGGTTVATTVEPPGGSDGPTGPIVLQGQIPTA